MCFCGAAGMKQKIGVAMRLHRHMIVQNHYFMNTGERERIQTSGYSRSRKRLGWKKACMMRCGRDWRRLGSGKWRKKWRNKRGEVDV